MPDFAAHRRRRAGHADDRSATSAAVDDSVVEPRSLSRYNGQNAVTLLVRKQSGTTPSRSSTRSRSGSRDPQHAAAGRRRHRHPRPGDASSAPSLAEVQKHLIVGALLRRDRRVPLHGQLRATLIAAVAIPCSVIATFTLMQLMGFTLNSLTLLALTLAVGIVIDDAIVVLENIFRFIEEKGMTPIRGGARGDRARSAWRSARRRCRWSVIFVPVAFIPGVMAASSTVRPHHGGRDPGVAAGRVHADPDAVLALPQAEARVPSATIAPRLGSSARSTSLRARAALVAAPPLGGGRASRCARRVDPAAGQLVGTTFMPDEDDRATSRSTSRRRRATALARTDAVVARSKARCAAARRRASVTNVGDTDGDESRDRRPGRRRTSRRPASAAASSRS